MANIIYHSGMFIGRTDAWYNDDDESLYTPEYWTYSDDENDKEFAAEHEVHELTAAGYAELQEYLSRRRMNDYYRRRAGRSVFDRMSHNQVWDYLTSDKSFIVDQLRDGTEIDVQVCVADEYDDKDDIQHLTWDDEYEASYENACDCLYYGEGRSKWQHDIEDEELANIIWEAARDTLAEGYRY